MQTIRKFATSLLFWLGLASAAGAAGAAIWASGFRPYLKFEADGIVGQIDDLRVEVSTNTLDALNRSIWQLEARERNGTITGEERQILNSLREQRRRLIEDMARRAKKG